MACVWIYGLRPHGEKSLVVHTFAVISANTTPRGFLNLGAEWMKTFYNLLGCLDNQQANCSSCLWLVLWFKKVFFQRPY